MLGPWTACAVWHFRLATSCWKGHPQTCGEMVPLQHSDPLKHDSTSVTPIYGTMFPGVHAIIFPSGVSPIAPADENPGLKQGTPLANTGLNTNISQVRGPHRVSCTPFQMPLHFLRSTKLSVCLLGGYRRKICSGED